MLVVDADVIIRFLTKDDLTKAKRFKKFLESGKAAAITEVTLAEVYWTLHSFYRYPKQKIIDALYSPSVDLRKTVVLEETPPGFAGNVADDATVSITNYEPEKVELSVEAQRDGLVFLSDTYDPGWKAVVDGKETKIFRANFTFRAVVVPRGSHQILFTYDPLSFRIGLWTSIVSVIIVCIVIIRKHEA